MKMAFLDLPTDVVVNVLGRLAEPDLCNVGAMSRGGLAAYRELRRARGDDRLYARMYPQIRGPIMAQGVPGAIGPVVSWRLPRPDDGTEVALHRLADGRIRLVLMPSGAWLVRECGMPWMAASRPMRYLGVPRPSQQTVADPAMAARLCWHALDHAGLVAAGDTIAGIEDALRSTQGM